MIQVFADGTLAYDSRLRAPGQDYSLLALKTTEGLNKSGAAEIRMPPGHPAYNSFVSFRTVVTLYENKILRFRGRALYPDDDNLNRRTIYCEGERGFFRDATIRPYLFQDTPAAIFAAALALYNSEVDEFKQFELGQVTVTDPNDYVRLESTKAEKYSDFFDKLISRCGGYLTFRDGANGRRIVDWLAQMGTESVQAIEFGSNLLTFARSGQSADLATAIIPYGALQEDGTRVTVASVTADGSDCIQDDDAVALRGRIVATMTWDDVTEPANLLKKARQWLDEKRLAITSLQLTAADLSKFDRSIGAYHIGDRVPVRSKPHNVDEPFLLTDKTTDWLNPSAGTVSMGKSKVSMTGADVAGDRNSSSALDKVQAEVTTKFKNELETAVSNTTRTLSSHIQQASDTIAARVSSVEETARETQGQMASLELKADGLDMAVSDVRKQVDEKADKVSVQEFTEHFHFGEDGLTISNSATGMGINVSETQVAFTGGADPTTVITPTEMQTTNLRVGERLDLGNFALLPRTNGNLSMRWTGG